MTAGEMCDDALPDMAACFKRHMETEEHEVILRSLEVTPILPLTSALPLLCRNFAIHLCDLCMRFSNRETFFAYLTCSKTALRKCPDVHNLPNIVQERHALNDLCHKLYRVNMSCVQERTAVCRKIMKLSGHLSVEDMQVDCRSFGEARACSRRAGVCVQGKKDVFDSYFQAVAPPTCSAPLRTALDLPPLLSLLLGLKVILF